MQIGTFEKEVNIEPIELPEPLRQPSELPHEENEPMTRELEKKLEEVSRKIICHFIYQTIISNG